MTSGISIRGQYGGRISARTTGDGADIAVERLTPSTAERHVVTIQPRELADLMDVLAVGLDDAGRARLARALAEMDATSKT